MEDWMDRQRASQEETPRGPRIGYAEPSEEQPRRVKVSHETYVIFRPWQLCQRCKSAVDENPALLPDAGEHVCPHTRHSEYIALVNRLRNAGPGGPMKLSAREFSNDRGELYVTIAWEEPEAGPVESKKPPRGVPRM